MIVEPKVRDFICTTAHPDGCKKNIENQICFTKSMPSIDGAKKVLVIGSSTGYGMASRIAAAYSFGAATIGIQFEKPAAGKRTATAGWYNTAAFEAFAEEDSLYAKTINGDAFSKEVKEQTIELIKKDLGKIDMVIYSLAAPRRTVPDGSTYSSVLKTVGEAFVNKSLNLRDNTVVSAAITPAEEDEINATVKVMGGEDWLDWIDALMDADVLEDNAVTMAYSYIGSSLTYPVYKNGTIGHAKEHLYKTSLEINKKYKDTGIKAYISVNKALVTQSSSAIPIVPLYIAILYRVQKGTAFCNLSHTSKFIERLSEDPALIHTLSEGSDVTCIPDKNTHEGCIHQIYRLFHDKFYVDIPIVDRQGIFRMDDYELDDVIQDQILSAWEQIDTESVHDLADINGYWEDFYNMFGFHLADVDYDEDVNIQVNIPSIRS